MVLTSSDVSQKLRGTKGRLRPDDQQVGQSKQKMCCHHRVAASHYVFFIFPWHRSVDQKGTDIIVGLLSGSILSLLLVPHC